VFENQTAIQRFSIRFVFLKENYRKNRVIRVQYLKSLVAGDDPSRMSVGSRVISAKDSSEKKKKQLSVPSK